MLYRKILMCVLLLTLLLSAVAFSPSSTSAQVGTVLELYFAIEDISVGNASCRAAFGPNSYMEGYLPANTTSLQGTMCSTEYGTIPLDAAGIPHDTILWGTCENLLGSTGDLVESYIEPAKYKWFGLAMAQSARLYCRYT